MVLESNAIIRNMAHFRRYNSTLITYRGQFPRTWLRKTCYYSCKSGIDFLVGSVPYLMSLDLYGQITFNFLLFDIEHDFFGGFSMRSHMNIFVIHRKSVLFTKECSGYGVHIFQNIGGLGSTTRR